MRDLKFRAYDPDLKGWIKPNVLKTFELGELNGEDNPFIFMQYTGLKDINGKEIYEGDIIKHIVLSKEYLDKVWWDEDRWVVGSWQPNGLSEYLCEVIGNIYENPELLKV